MKTTIIKNGQEEYYKVDLISINQKGKTFYLGKMNAIDFLKIYTVRPAEYDYKKHTALANSFPEETDYYNHLINIDKKNIGEKNFQREANKERVNGIKHFLENEDFALFPNTIIANCDLINDWENFSIESDDNVEVFFALNNKPNYLSFLQKENEKDTLYIPLVQNSVLVIDGQHRLEGLKLSSIDLQNDYELIITFIIGYDRSVVAKQFYTINYEQKPVNKSLLYQLTGEFSRDFNEISYLHNVVKLLNEIHDSPFFKRIKMLGVTPKDIDQIDKKNLSISQAFLIDSMLRFLSKQAKGTNYPPIFLKYFNNSSEHADIIKTVARFFNAVKVLKPDWSEPNTSIISKGMGVGALMKVLNLLYPIIFTEKGHNWNIMKDLKTEDYKLYLAGIENVDFSSNGPYGKSGSAGTINKIKEDIIENLTYWGNKSNYKDFELKHKSDILSFSNFLI